MGAIIEIPGTGPAYLPTAWENLIGDDASPKRVALGAKRYLNAIVKQLHRGGCALVAGSWDDIAILLATLGARKRELLGRVEQRGRGGGRRGFWGQAYRHALSRVLITASADGALDTVPLVRVPHLLEFLGDARYANAGLPLIVPAVAIQELLASLEERYRVAALEADLFAPQSVLQPRQQEVYDLLRERLLALRAGLPPEPVALDMGCGSGALALLVAHILREAGVHVWATDTLPEALATTRLNVAKLTNEGKIAPGIVNVTDGGDLYAPVFSQQFDLVVFNPPWANARSRTRLEVARYDPQQRTVRRFLEATPEHLREDGHLLLFYADNAGPKAVETVEGWGAAAGLQIAEVLSRRIRVARRWEHIYLYDMMIQ